MKEILLPHGLVTLVDNDDFEKLSVLRWHVTNGYVYRDTRRGGRKFYLMHRVIMNTPKGMFTDHIDGNKLNNQKSNLRICSNHQNRFNQGLASDNTSGYKGVWHCKASNRFHAYITKDGTRKHLGSFENIIAASQAYDAAAIIMFGKFARTNEVINGTYM